VVEKLDAALDFLDDDVKKRRKDLLATIEWDASEVEIQRLRRTTPVHIVGKWRLGHTSPPWCSRSSALLTVGNASGAIGTRALRALRHAMTATAAAARRA